MSISEKSLIDGIKLRDREAQQALYDRYVGRLLSISLRYVAQREIAEDIVHDSFIKIFNAIDTFNYRGEGSLRAWMERVTINCALSWLRSNKRLNFTTLNSDLKQHNIEEEPSYEQSRRIPHDVVMRLIGELPDGYRAVFNLYCIEEYSHREIAEQLNIQEKSSSSQLLRAKRLLAGKINEWIRRHGEK